MYGRLKFPLGKIPFVMLLRIYARKQIVGGYSKGNNLFLGVTMGVPDKLTMGRTGHESSLDTYRRKCKR